MSRSLDSVLDSVMEEMKLMESISLSESEDQQTSQSSDTSGGVMLSSRTFQGAEFTSVKTHFIGEVWREHFF